MNFQRNSQFYGKYIYQYLFWIPLVFTYFFLARKFALDKVQPLVRQMDDNSQLEQSIIDGLFEQGVRFIIWKQNLLGKISLLP